jgi:outer membrane protein OmpA-like peptidoglycan-associated protein
MKNLLVALGTISVVALNSIHAQDDRNLVQNPSFEAEKGKLKKLNQIDVATDWSSPTGMKADLFSSGKPAPVSPEENPYGKEKPAEGKNSAGILMYSYNNKEPRTYVQNKLMAPLRKDVEYCIKFQVSLADLSKYAVNNFNVYFSKDQMNVAEKIDIIFDKDKDKQNMGTITDNKIYMGRYGYETVCVTYKASGKEQYMIIGNFYNNKETQLEKMKKKEDFPGTQVPKAYYYLDMVEVFIMEDPSECACNQATETRESIVYHKEYTSADGFDIEEQLKLATIYFDVNNVKLESSMMKDLEILAGTLIANPEYKLVLTGHMDAKEGKEARDNPDNEYQANLGMLRAEKVKEYLVKKGIDANRITCKTSQDKSLASPGSTDLDHAKNRRVEFKLIK